MADGTFLRFPRDLRPYRNSGPDSADRRGSESRGHEQEYERHESQGYEPQGYQTRGHETQGHETQAHDYSGYDSQAYDSQAYDSHADDSHADDRHDYASRDYERDRPDHDGANGAPGRGGHTDPLVELARLIGRTDPFASIPRRSSPPPDGGADAARYGSVESGYGSVDYRPLDGDQNAYDQHGTAHSGRDEHLEFSAADHDRDDRFRNNHGPAPRAALAAAAELEAELGDAAPADTAADYSHSHYPNHLPPLESPATLASDAFLASEEEAARGSPQYDPPQDAADYTNTYATEEASRHGEYDYEAGPADDYRYEGAAGKRRYSAKVALAVLGLAVFGTAGAFGYRAVFKRGPQGAPPVIHADTSPTKIVPSGTSGDAGSKPINERLGDSSQERLMKREEVPVQLPDPARATGPAVPLAAVTNSVPAAATAPAVPVSTAPGVAPGATPPAAGAGGTTEPKRVRTVSIRADQAISAPQTRVASARSATGAPLGAPPVSGGAPLALTPQAVNAAAAVVGSTDATHTRARPPGGGFVVQVSAQKSESEVEASFHAMQTRYTVLGGRQPLIRRKDQGERGVFYVAQVGPFGTKDEASQLCETLKTEGGTCFVQKN